MTHASVHRWPLWPTALVALAIATMVGLGIWQLGRADEKRAQIALFERNSALSSTVAMPRIAPVPDEARYRRSSAICLEVVGWREVGGRGVDGGTGYRHLADCRTGAEGPGFVADMGLAEDPAFQPAWRGGPVEGIIAEEPVEGGLWSQLTGTRPVPRPMLVAATPAPGLRASAPPDPSQLTNNSLAYAVQWFFFAAAAALIYWLALRQRWRKAADTPQPTSNPPTD